MKHKNDLNTNELLYYFQKIRLNKDQAIITRQLEKCTPLEGGEKISTFFKNSSKKFDKWLNDYELIYQNVMANQEKFDTTHDSVLSDEDALDIMNKLFKNDKYGLVKLVFASTVLLDQEYKYNYKEEGLMAVSKILYGDENILLTINDNLERNYKEIYSNELSTVQKGILFSTAAACLAGIIVCPTIASLGAAASTGAILAETGIMVAEASLIGAAITGAVYGGMKLYNIKKVKEQFRQLSPEDSALYLAIQMTLITKLKKELSEDDFKNELDEILKSINNLKGDLDFYLFVEKDDQELNINKLNQFHKFDKRLVEILNN